MPDFNPLVLPFVNRKMLSYDTSARFTLRVKHQSILAGTFDVIGATKDQTFTFRVETTGTGVMQTSRLSISDIPIWLSVRDEQDSFSPGNTYVSVSLEIDQNPIISLCSGYVSGNVPLNWPVAQHINAMPNIGNINVITGTDPAAGSEISKAVPTGEWWKVKGVLVTLVTSATVATRQVKLNIGPTGATALVLPSPVTQTATLTRNYTWAPVGFAPTTAAGTDILCPLPCDLILHDGATISTTTDNIQAGDDFGAPLFYVERGVAGV